MTTAFYPGSFDPMTNGHLDIISRACNLFDEVVVAVLINKKKQGMFTVEERIELLREVTADHPNVVVDSFHGLLVDFCREREIAAIVKGLRAVSDFDYELQMAQMNHALSGIETVMLPTAARWAHLSSTMIREVALLGGDVEQFVTPEVAARVRAKVAERRGP